VTPTATPARTHRSPWWVAMVGVGMLLVGLGWWRVSTAQADVQVVDTARDGVPITLLVPAGGQDAPGVVVAHGFAGSRQLMLGFGLALARTGSLVALPDLPGHGANAARLDRDDDAGLVAAVDTALGLLREHPEVAPDRLVLLGHSMGSGAVLRAGMVADPPVAGVIAVSPTDADVTATSPPNLLLLAGSLEPRFVANAEDLLARAGGASTDVTDAAASGVARGLEVVDGVEHVSILFSPTAHRAAVTWVGLVADGGSTPPGAPVPPIAWWALHLVGVLLIWRAMVPPLVAPVALPPHRGRPLVGAAAGALAAGAALAAVGALVPLASIGGMLVGPAISLWFAIAGGVWLWLGDRPPRPDRRDLGWGLALLVVLVAAFGLLASRVWLPWFPIPARSALIPLLAGLTLPWTLAFATTLQGRRAWRVVGWWAAVSGVLVAGLIGAALLVPALGFVVLLLPLLPALLALIVVAGAPLQRPWASAGGAAVFLGWTMAVMFPLG
jgi:dienelactone hydrolase